MKRTNLLALILLLLLCAVSQGAFKFVVWADNRPYDSANEARFIWMLNQINELVGNTPAFHVIAGDYDYTSNTEAAIAGHSLIKDYYLVPGNHDPEQGSGHDYLDYPTSTPEARLIFLDEYYCPSTDPLDQCDCSGGRVCSHTLAWLSDLLSEASSKGYVSIVVGHEPAYPQYRHIGDSLDALPSERDAFWTVLAQYNAPYICGHTHYYSEYSTGGATQIDVGNAGNPGNAFQTFVLFEVIGGSEGSIGSYSTTTYHTEYNVSAFPPATNPMPSNQADGISATPVLTWSGGAGAIHRVYFAPALLTLPTEPVETSEASCTVKYLEGYQKLAYETNYIWRVDEYYDTEHITQGPVWTFKTKAELTVSKALSESTAFGFIVGDIDGTENRDDVNEELTEVSNVPNKNGYGILDHTWRFDNIPSGVYTQFRIEAFRTDSDLSDTYTMSYSTNGTTFSPLLTIDKTDDDNQEEIVIFAEPGAINGTVWVRVTNTDRTKRSQIFDTLLVDCMYFVSSDKPILGDVVLPESGNQSPVADAGDDQTVFDTDESDDETVTIDGTGSNDPDGSIVQYEWAVNGLPVPVPDPAPETWDILTYNFLVGTHTVTLTVTDNEEASHTDNTVIAVVAAGSTMHVSAIDIEISIKKSGPNTFIKARATVTIVGKDGNPIGGATVQGHWSGAASDTDTGLTDANGVVTLESDQVKIGTTFTFTVDNVTKSGLDYVPATNFGTSGSITYP